MYKKKFFSHIILIFMLFNLITTIPVTQAASLDNMLNTLATSTISSQDNTNQHSGLLGNLFDLVFNKLLGPIFNIFNGKTAPTTTSPVPPEASNPNTIPIKGSLTGKVIVVDPGHGGSNPGAVANNTRESDNNLAVALKLRDKLVQAGAKVIMTRETDRTVAPEGSSLGTELEARVNLAESNHADLFVSVHSNENPDTNIAGAMTFYPAGKSSTLALDVENAVSAETGAINKGTSSATFYVLRNTSMPSILVEMGFVSNKEEAALLNNDSYRTKIAEGILNGVVRYYTN